MSSENKYSGNLLLKFWFNNDIKLPMSYMYFPLFHMLKRFYEVKKLVINLI